MSYKFSKRSKKILSGAHPDLQRLFNEVIKVVDCTVIESYRSRASQNALCFEGKSKLKYPHSKHNHRPSLAVDVIPYPVDWKDFNRFYFFAGLVKGIASQMGIKIRMGADWDGDNDFKDQFFHDMPHFELEE